MCFIDLLMNCLFASRALFVIFTIGALCYKMISEGANFDSLSALVADSEHRTCIKIMHIFIILFHKTLVYSFAKLTDLILVYHINILIDRFLGNLYKFITTLKLILILIFFDTFLWLFICSHWPLIKSILICS